MDLRWTWKSRALLTSRIAGVEGEGLDGDSGANPAFLGDSGGCRTASMHLSLALHNQAVLPRCSTFALTVEP